MSEIDLPVAEHQAVLNVPKGEPAERRGAEPRPARSDAGGFRHVLRNRSRMRERRESAGVPTRRQPIRDEKGVGGLFPPRRRQYVQSAPQLVNASAAGPARGLTPKIRRIDVAGEQQAGLEQLLFRDDVDSFRKFQCARLPGSAIWRAEFVAGTSRFDRESLGPGNGRQRSVSATAKGPSEAPLELAATRVAGRTGRTRLADLLIAATAAAHGLPPHTRNPGDFTGLDGIVRVVGVWNRTPQGLLLMTDDVRERAGRMRNGRGHDRVDYLLGAGPMLTGHAMRRSMKRPMS